MRAYLGWPILAAFAAGLGAQPATEPVRSPANEPVPAAAVEFVSKLLDRYPIVAIADMPGCRELHEFFRDLIGRREITNKLGAIVVEFGNPLFQPVLDRYLLEGELVSRETLRHVWSDTTRSLDLTWDSPVYEEFFDAVRALNLQPGAQKIRIILADAPVNWDEVRSRQDLLRMVSSRSRGMTAKINAVVDDGQRVLWISSAEEQSRGPVDNARALIEKVRPGSVFAILPQGRFGSGKAYLAVEAAESAWRSKSIAPVSGTWLESLPVSAGLPTRRLGESVDAILYVGPSESLQRAYPRASIFRDDDYWMELNRRSQILLGHPFLLSNAVFDLRVPTPRAPRRAAGSPPPILAQDAHIVGAGDFMVQALDKYPVVAISDIHLSLEMYEFLSAFIGDPRLPGRLNDILVECGNPLFQAVMDRYIVEGQDVPREDRKGAWEYSAIGWPVSNSPVYEKFFDAVRAVNLKLPLTRRLRIVFADAPVDMVQFREDPAGYLRSFSGMRETAADLRESSIARSVNREIAQGRHALMICGNGHLRSGGRAGNVRELVDKENPGKLTFIDLIDPADDVPMPAGSVVVRNGEGRLSVGALETLTTVQVPPLLFRDTQYWNDINRMNMVQRREPVDLASPAFQYIGRYFEKPLPAILEGGADIH